MQQKYPKLTKSIKENIVQAHKNTQMQPGYGIIMDYDSTNNTATVLMSSAASDEPGELLKQVMCPTHIGVQSVAPEPGRPCWVVFKNGTIASPIITNYFNHAFDQVDYTKQYQATNPLPRFMMIM